jgi:hypothetical protein
MRLIGLAVLLTVSVMLAPLAAEAQGWLALVAEPPLQDEFRSGMRELGPLPGELQSYIGYRGASGPPPRKGRPARLFSIS